MNCIRSCLCTFAALFLLVIPSMSFASDLPRDTGVTCVMGSFVTPHDQHAWHYSADDRLLVTLHNIPPVQMAALNNCYRGRRGVGNVFYLPLPFINSRGATARKVIVILCVQDGAYIYRKIIAPKKSFTYTFNRKSELPKTSGIARIFCK